MQKALSLLLSVAIGLAAPQSAKAQQGNTGDEATTAIRLKVDTYLQSIMDANVTLGATVWSPTPDVSFIQPLGSQKGWDQIASDVYRKLMGETFTKRTLKTVGAVNIEVYGNAAVAEFNWDFVAVLRSNGQTIHTTGRETQVYVNLPDKGWRLVHVHYSGPPVSGPG
jgi:ketosteroid isomerase-like protein